MALIQQLLASFGAASAAALAAVLRFTLNNPNAYGTSTNDYLGYSVSVSGNKGIVGAYGEGDAAGARSGKAYIFDVSTGSLLFTLTNPNPVGTSANNYFGISVSISGDRCIVSAQGESDASWSNSGKAYIYDVTTGALLFTLDNPNAFNTSANDYFGTSVSIDANRCIVGTNTEDDAGGLSSGKAYIFDVTTGALLFTLNNPNPFGTSLSDNFGISVSISGDRCIVGAYQEDDASGTDSGKAYIYDVTTGALLFTLNNPNPFGTSAQDYFGYSVSISGNKCIVGAYGEDDASGTDSGKAYIYDVTTGALLFTLDNPNPFGTSASDQFGLSVSISDTKCVVSAYVEDTSGNLDSGKAYIYDVATGALLSTVNNPNAYSAAAYDNFGVSVSISGNKCLVGAYGEDDAAGTMSGKAYVFDV